MLNNPISDVKMKLSIRNIIILVFLLLFFVSLATKFNGYIDVGDYADTAKFFSENQQAKLRSSHSLVYGLIHAPFSKLTDSLIFMKISSAIWLFLIILSVYYISEKDKRTLLLIVTCPVIWYMAPWINPIQLAGLLFLWSYFFIKKYDSTSRLKYLFLSGFLTGLSWAMWDAVIYFAFFVTIVFFYNKISLHLLYFLLAIFAGTAPKLIVDQIFFGFAFFSIAKHFFAVVAFNLVGGIYGGETNFNFLNMVIVLLVIPAYGYLLLTKNAFRNNGKDIMFLIFSTIIIVLNAAQIRYLIFIMPIFILVLAEYLNPKQFKIQIIIFLILSTIVVTPYIIQIKYETNGKEFSSLLRNINNLKFSLTAESDLILEDLESISLEHPSEIFIVAPAPDDFQYLAGMYWGDGIDEFVSIQDFNLFLNNKTDLASKTICSKSVYWNRRDICSTVTLRKTIDDRTDYENINFAISLDGTGIPIGFEQIEKYNILYLFEKTNSKI